MNSGIIGSMEWTRHTVVIIRPHPQKIDHKFGIPETITPYIYPETTIHYGFQSRCPLQSALKTWKSDL